jgi:hypothetical protein
MWSSPRLYHTTDQVQLVSPVQLGTVELSELVSSQLVEGLLQFSHCDLFLLEAGS